MASRRLLGHELADLILGQHLRFDDGATHVFLFDARLGSAVGDGVLHVGGRHHHRRATLERWGAIRHPDFSAHLLAGNDDFDQRSAGLDEVAAL